MILGSPPALPLGHEQNKRFLKRTFTGSMTYEERI